MALRANPAASALLRRTLGKDDTGGMVNIFDGVARGVANLMELWELAGAFWDVIRRVRRTKGV